MAAVVGIISGRGISIHTYHGNWPNKSKVVLYKPLLHCKNQLNSCSYISNKVEGFSYKGGCG